MSTTARYDAATSGIFTATLLRSDGTAIPLSELNTLTLTVTNSTDGSIVNSRNAQNVKNANNVTVHATTGAVEWEIQVADTTMVDSAASFEEHVAVFKWTYQSSGDATVQTGRHEHRLQCRNFLMLCTVDDVKFALGQNVDEDKIPLIEMLIEGISTRVETETLRKFKKSTVASPTTELFSPRENTWHLRVERYPIDSIVSIKEAWDGAFSGANSNLIDAEDYAYIANEGIIKMRDYPFMEGDKTVQVIYTGGLSREAGGVPMDLRLAAVRQVVFWYQQRTRPGVIELQVSGFGKSKFIIDLIPDMQRAIDNYRAKFF